MRGPLDGSRPLGYIRDTLSSYLWSPTVTLTIELEREADGRWVAEVPALPGVMTYGASRPEAIARVQALALRVLAERLEHGEADPELLSVSFAA